MWNLPSNPQNVKICLLFNVLIYLFSLPSLPFSASATPLPVSSSAKVCALHSAFCQTFLSHVLRLRLRRGGDQCNPQLLCASSVSNYSFFLSFLSFVWIVSNSHESFSSTCCNILMQVQLKLSVHRSEKSAVQTDRRRPTQRKVEAGTTTASVVRHLAVKRRDKRKTKEQMFDFLFVLLVLNEDELFGYCVELQI